MRLCWIRAGQSKSILIQTEKDTQRRGPHRDGNRGQCADATSQGQPGATRS